MTWILVVLYRREFRSSTLDAFVAGLAPEELASPALTAPGSR